MSSRKYFQGTRARPIAMLSKHMLPITVAHAQAACLPPYMHLKSPRPPLQSLGTSSNSTTSHPRPTFSPTVDHQAHGFRFMGAGQRVKDAVELPRRIHNEVEAGALRQRPAPPILHAAAGEPSVGRPLNQLTQITEEEEGARMQPAAATEIEAQDHPGTVKPRGVRGDLCIEPQSSLNAGWKQSPRPSTGEVRVLSGAARRRPVSAQELNQMHRSRESPKNVRCVQC